MKKNYTETNVIRILDKKQSIAINPFNKVISVVKNATDVGNGSWGKIDYLCKVHNYIYVFCERINKKQRVSCAVDNAIVDNGVDNKQIKRDNKINMAAMSKAAMRKTKK